MTGFFQKFKQKSEYNKSVDYLNIIKFDVKARAIY